MTAANPERTRRRGPRGDLDRGTWVTAATRVLDEDGLAGLTLRRVAATAGATPNALYSYVADMDELANLVGDAFLGGLDLPALLGTPEPLRVRLRAVYRTLWAALHEHPGMARLLASRRIVGPGSMALNEALLRAFVEHGLDIDRAREAVHVLTAQLHGQLVCTLPDGRDATIARALAELDPADYPLSASGPGAVEAERDQPEGLERVLDGLGID